MKTKLLFAIGLLMISVGGLGQTFNGSGIRITDKDSACRYIKQFFKSISIDSALFNNLRRALDASDIRLHALITKIKNQEYHIGYTSEKSSDGHEYLIVCRRDNDNISFYQEQCNRINPINLSRWIMYQLIIVSKPNQMLNIDSSRNPIVAEKITEIYTDYLNTIIIPKPKLSHIDFEIECNHKMIPSDDFDALVIRDASYLMGGESGKLKQSKVALNLFNPTIQSFVQTLNSANSLSLQIGATAKLDQPVDFSNWNRANFKGIFSLQLDKVLGKNIYHFYADSCINCILDSYGNYNLNKSNAYDSLYSKIEWNAKCVTWISFKADGIFKSYNIYSPSQNDTLLKGAQGGFSGELSYNIHHYINPKFKKRSTGNSYLKIGAAFSLANKIDNENLKAVEFETYENAADSTKKITTRLNAFDENDFKNQTFTLSPFADFYIMNKKRNLGAHVFGKYNMPFDKGLNQNQSLITAFGIFTSIPQKFTTEMFRKTEGSVLNIELLFTSGNLFDKSVKTQSFFGGIFRPEMKFEIPFKLLDH
ncbi:hypothetical protein [Niabella hirudinis]|uniref:hypothetical protein n=1 Tax=Niabella hirudinis TaxID=1285929 RepID=UPI003EBAC7F5